MEPCTNREVYLQACRACWLWLILVVRVVQLVIEHWSNLEDSLSVVCACIEWLWHELWLNIVGHWLSIVDDFKCWSSSALYIEAWSVTLFLTGKWTKAEKWLHERVVERGLQILLQCHVFSFWTRVGEARDKRLSLNKRRHNIQTKKRQCGESNLRRFYWNRNKRGLQIFCLIICSWTVESMDEQQFTQLMGAFDNMLQRQNRMAEHTATVMARLPELISNAGGGSSSSLARNLESAAKILKSPETFDSSDASTWIVWRHSFLNWLSYSNQQFLEGIRDIEKLEPHVEVDDEGWSDEQWDVARKLYAILTSYLKGSSLQLSRAQGEERNGFKLWKALSDHFAPATRQRSLSLSQATTNFPMMEIGKLAEQMAGLEALVQEYDILRSKAFYRDVLLGVLLRVCPESIRQHLTFAVDEGTTYKEVREKILSYERSTRAWSMSDALKNVAQSSKSNSLGGTQNDAGGAAPMEVDQVAMKGKGKSKGKGGWKGKSGKGSWSGWSNAWNGFSSWFKGYGKNKGKKGKSKGKSTKGKSKGKFYGKSKGKSKSRKGDSDRCRICGQSGHWGNECPNRSTPMVMEVRQDDTNSARAQQDEVRRSTASSVYSSTTASTGGGRTVRRVKMYHVATPPERFPEELAMSEVSEAESWNSYWGRPSVRMVSMVDCCMNYDMFDQGDIQVEAEQLTDDAFYEWLCQGEEGEFPCENGS